MPPDLDRTLAALSDPTRRRVVDLLRREPRKSGALAEELATTRPAMSRHLKVLRQSGLVEEHSPEADARVRVYQLCPGPFAELRGWVEEVEAFGGDQLAAFKAHAEGARTPRRGRRSRRR